MIAVNIQSNGTELCSKEVPLPLGYAQQSMAEFTRFVASQCGYPVHEILNMKIGRLGMGHQPDVMRAAQVKDGDTLFVAVRNGVAPRNGTADQFSPSAQPTRTPVARSNSGPQTRATPQRGELGSNRLIKCVLKTCYNLQREHCLSVAFSERTLATITQVAIKHFALPSESVELWIDPMKIPVTSPEQLMSSPEVFVSCAGFKEVIVYFASHPSSPGSIFVRNDTNLSDLCNSVKRIYNIPPSHEVFLKHVTSAALVTESDITFLVNGAMFIATTQEPASKHIKFYVTFGNMSAAVQHPTPATSQTKPQFVASIHQAALRALNLPDTLPVVLQNELGEVVTNTSSFTGNLFLACRRGTIFTCSLEDSREIQYLVLPQPPSWNGLYNSIETAFSVLQNHPYTLYTNGDHLVDLSMVKTLTHVIAYPTRKHISMDSSSSDLVVVSTRDESPPYDSADIKPIAAVSDEELQRELASFVGMQPMRCEDPHAEPSDTAEEEGESVYCFPVANEMGVFAADNDSQVTVDSDMECAYMRDVPMQPTKSQGEPSLHHGTVTNPPTMHGSHGTILPPIQGASTHVSNLNPSAPPYVPPTHCSGPPPSSIPVAPSASPQKEVSPRAVQRSTPSTNSQPVTQQKEALPRGVQRSIPPTHTTPVAPSASPQKETSPRTIQRSVPPTESLPMTQQKEALPRGVQRAVPPTNTIPVQKVVAPRGPQRAPPANNPTFATQQIDVLPRSAQRSVPSTASFETRVQSESSTMSPHPSSHTVQHRNLDSAVVRQVATSQKHLVPVAQPAPVTYPLEERRKPFYATVKLNSFHEHFEPIMVEIRAEDSLEDIGKKCLLVFDITAPCKCSFLALLDNGAKAGISTITNIFDLCDGKKTTLLLRLDGNVAPCVLLRLYESDKPPHAMVVPMTWSWDTFLQHVRRSFEIYDRTIHIFSLHDNVRYADVASIRDMDMLLVKPSNERQNNTPVKAAIVKLKSVTPVNLVKMAQPVNNHVAANNQVAEVRRDADAESKVLPSSPRCVPPSAAMAEVLTDFQRQIKAQVVEIFDVDISLPHLQYISERCKVLEDALMMFFDTKDTFVAPAKSAVPAVIESKAASKPQPAPREMSFEEQMLEIGYTQNDIRRAREAGALELDSAVSFIEHMRSEESAVVIPNSLRPYKRELVTTLLEMKYSTKNIEEALQRYSTLNECLSYLTGEDQRECVLCRERHSQADMMLVGCCQHRYCYEMLAMYVQRSLDGDHETPACIPACPNNHECNYLFMQGELEHFLETAWNRGLIDARDYDRLRRKMHSLYIAKAHHDNGHVRCVGCKGENDEGVWFSIPDNAAKGVTCPMCRTSFCLECKSTPYHYGCECAEVMQHAANWLRWIEHDRNEYMQELARHNQQYQQVLAEFNRKREEHAKEAEDAAARHRELEENEEWKAANCKVCPSCRRCINKLSGCDSMRCGSDAHGGNNQPGCGATFNWSTAPPYVPLVGPRREVGEFQEEIPQNAHEVHHELADGIPRICDHCQQAIVGLRIKCINCVEYNTCLQCSIAAPHNPQHTCVVIHENIYF